MLCAILGFGHVLLNRPFRWLPWATESVYPWYILHQSLIVLLAYWLVPMKLGPAVEPLLIGAGTLVMCALLTSGLIARVGWLRPLFGLKRMAAQRAYSQSIPAMAKQFGQTSTGDFSSGKFRNTSTGEACGGKTP